MSGPQRFKLPVRTGVEVQALEADTDEAGGYIVKTTEGVFRAAQVIIAGGYYRKPHLPDFASDLDPDIRQEPPGLERGLALDKGSVGRGVARRIGGDWRGRRRRYRLRRARARRRRRRS